MHGAGLIIGLLAAVAVLAWLARVLRIAYPILLVIGGVGLSLIPNLPLFQIDPEAIILFFLPPLIYYSAPQTTWRDFKANLRPITLLAVGLVIFTMCAVALVSHTLVSGMTWPAAFILGAIVSPPDAIAATAILQQLQIPRRIIVILEGESLVNDATALVAYRIALGAALAAGSFSLGGAMLRFVLAAIGGIIIGYAVGVIIAWVRPRVKDNGIDMTLSLLTPFLSYLPAALLDASGVLAVVTTGIYISRRLPHFASSQTRLRGYALWETVVFILNGVVFILIGLQLREVLASLGGGALLPKLIGLAAIISFVAITVRILWVFPATYLPLWLIPSIRRKEAIPPWRPVFLVAWTGLRGILSLAAALALPMTLPDGVTPFPARNLILFITFGVIFATLVLQGLTIAPVARWLGLGTDDDAGDEEVTARYLSALAAVEHLDRLASNRQDGDDALDMISRLRETYDDRIQFYSRRLAGDVENAEERACISCDTRGRVIRETIGAERAMLLRLRDGGVIGDEALRKIQHELDLEESRLEADES